MDLMKNNYSIEEITKLLEKQGYITDSAIAMSIHLSLLLKKPLLIEGPAGVGKTCLLYTSPSPRDRG